jgi:hypothetical protein
MKIANPAAQRAYKEWWSRLSREGDPIRRAKLVTEAFIAGWSAAVARAASIAGAHPHKPDADSDCLDAQGCCEAIAGEIGELVERPK